MGYSRCCLVLGVVMCACAQTVLRDDHNAGIVDRAIVVPKSEFTRQRVEGLSKDFLALYAGAYSLLRLTIGTEPSEVARSLYHGGGHDSTIYERTIEYLRKTGMPNSPIARLIALRSGALLSYWDETGLKESVIAGDHDPTRIAVAGVEYRLLHFNFVDAGGKPSATFYPYFLHLYLKTSSTISLGSCAALTQLLQRKTGIQRLAIAVRKNSWFLEDQSYPDVYRFEENIAIPSRLDAQLASQVSCTMTSGRISCSGRNFEP